MYIVRFAATVFERLMIHMTPGRRAAFLAAQENVKRKITIGNPLKESKAVMLFFKS